MTDQLPSKELFADLSLLRASGFDDAANEIERLREEDRRWANAHQILISENDRLRKQVGEIKPAHEREAPHCSTCACPPYQEPLETETRAATSRGAHSTEDAGRSRPSSEPPADQPGIPAHLEMLTKAPGMDTSNAPTEETQQKVVSAVNYHAREIARLTETWPVQSYTAYDIELFDAGRGVAARMRPEQNGRYYLRSDVDATRAAQPPGAEG